MVTATTNMSGAGYITPGSGYYNYGDYVVFTEYTSLGYQFDGWYLNGVYEGQLCSIPLTITQDYQLQAIYSKSVVELTVTESPQGGGTLAPSPGFWNYTYGDVVTVSEHPNAGCAFSGWYLNGVYMGAGTSIPVTMNQDNQLNAFFSGTPTNPGSTPTPGPTPPPLGSSSGAPVPSLSFYAISSTTSSGFNVQIQGALAYNEFGISGAGILLSYSVTDGQTWQPLAYVTTADNGSFSAVWMPSASGDYMVTAYWPGDYSYSGVSKTVDFAVEPFNNQQQNVFSVSSNSTLSSLAFNSATDSLSFTVSGPQGTTGYSQVCIPQSLVPNITNLNVTLDNSLIAYSYVSSGGSWIISFIYHHSTHKVVMDLNTLVTKSTATTSIASFLNNQLLLILIIAALVGVIAALVVMNVRKNSAAPKKKPRKRKAASRQ